MKRFGIALLALATVLCASFSVETFSQPGKDARRTILTNGLTVITKEIHTAPVVSLSVWYRVGSRNESTGITGISHLLEHLAFKGTKNFPQEGETDRIIRRLGGSGNAGTNVDYTVYYVTLPSGKLDPAIDIEADRMKNLLLKPEDVDMERPVVAEERKMRNEDSPTGLFWEEINSVAFKVHPYGWPIIGWMTDIMGINHDDITAYYASHYAPNNAVVVVTGDMDSEKVIEKIKSAFGEIPKAPAPPPMRAVEPEQKVEKRIVFPSDKSNLAYVVYAWHAPSITGSDSPALEVVSEVLSSGLESRLRKELVETGLASSADATHDTNQDPYLFYIEVEAQPGTDTALIEKKLDEQILKLQTEKVTDYELKRAKNRFAARETFENEGITAYGRKIGWFELTAGDYSFLDRYLESIQKVSAEDVMKVSKKYFTPTNRTVGILVPTGAPSGAIEKQSGHGVDYGRFGAGKTSSDAKGEIEAKEKKA
ncbi:MAG TPA: pitrilysin family protein, partial [bacterium]|nr:pitrilysin family protein [bacterium]